jgi:type II secretion system protein C
MFRLSRQQSRSISSKGRKQKVALRRVIVSLVFVLVSGLASGEGIRLIATMIADPDPGSASRAVFESDGRQIQVGIGDAVGGCTLAGITDKQVLLDCADGMVSLMLRSGIAAMHTIEKRRQTAHYQVRLPRREFLFALDDRQRIASQLSLEPFVKEGYLYGYRVAWIKPGGDFHRLGLRMEDVIISLNGVRASEPGAFMQAVNSLRGQASFGLGIDRDGSLIEYAYLLE